MIQLTDAIRMLHGPVRMAVVHKTAIIPVAVGHLRSIPHRVIIARRLSARRHTIMSVEPIVQQLEQGTGLRLIQRDARNVRLTIRLGRLHPQNRDVPHRVRLGLV